MQRRGAEQPVVQRVDEAKRPVVQLVGHRHHAGQQRGGETGPADAVLIPVGPFGEHLGLADLEAGVGVGVHRDVRHRPHRGAAVVLRNAGGHLAGLIEGLGEQLAGPAAATGVVGPGRSRRPGPVGQGRVRGLPPILVQPLAVAADQDAAAADARDVGEVCGELDGLGRQVGAACGVVAAVAGGEVHRDPGQRRFGGELLVERHVGGAEQGDVVGAVGPGVGDHVGDVAVDRGGPGHVQAGDAVRRPDVDDLGAGGHRVHGLDVEGLLAVPALRSAQVGMIEAVRVGHDLGELAALEQGLVVHLAVLLGVLQDRGRGVGVGDRHRGPAAVHARLEQRALAVGRLELLGPVAADGVGLVLTVGGRLVGGDLLRVVRRARLHPVPGAGRRPGLGVGDGLERGALVDPDHSADGAGDRGRGVDGQGELRGVRLHVLAQVGIGVQARPEGTRHLGDRTAGFHQHAAGQRLGDLEAFRAEPVLHRADRGLGRGVAGVEGRVGQPFTVAGAGRVGDRLQGGDGAGLVAHAQEHAEVHLLCGRTGAHVMRLVQPRGSAPVQRMPALRRGRRRRCRSGGQRQTDDGPAGQQPDGHFTGESRRTHT